MSTTEPTGSTLIGRGLEGLCTAVALGGGLMLLALVCLETLSVLGRGLPDLLGWTGIAMTPHAIEGDSEIAQLLTATALFAFLPYCQMRRGHLTVEAFTRSMPQRGKTFLDALWGAIFALVAATLTWRLTLGWLNKLGNHDSTMVLRIPEAGPFAAAALCSLLLTASVVWTLHRDLQRLR